MAARLTNLTNNQRQMVAMALYQMADAYDHESEFAEQGNEARQLIKLANEARELAAVVEQFKHLTGVA